MDNSIYSFIISTIAGLSTLIGFLFIYFKPNNINKFISICLSFSATLMLLISIFDLIPESFFSLFYKYKTFGLFISIISFIIGVLLIKLFNNILTKVKLSSNLYKVGIISAIVLMMHNIPEGIITFLTSSNDLELGIRIALAITLHNIPEGICIAVPIYYSTKSKLKAFMTTLISGLSEPLGAILAYLFLYKYVTFNILCLIFIFVAGIMITLSIDEIYKESFKYSNNKNNYLVYGIFIGILIFIINLFC